MRQITALLSFLVVLGVFWGLKLTGITMAGEAFCGFEEHRHDDTCLTVTMICGQEETPGHVHDESCILKQLVCQEEEVQPHVHDESCRVLELVCTEPEGEGHTHSDECREMILVCTMEEQEGHTHDEGCFADTLICADESPEHSHEPQCFEKTLICTVAESQGHQHEESCFTLGEAFTCGLNETVGHIHEEDCYLLHTCGMEETQGHVHSDGCYTYGIGFGCGLTEAEGHVHTDECVTPETQFGCGQTAMPPHSHTEECMEVLNDCPLPEHTHVESCYSNINADLESKEDWERSVADVEDQFTTAEMLVAVARSQLGYTESVLNFEVDLYGIRRGITRYGQWYGNPYGDWSAMFVSFCLHYAGATELPANAGPEAMRLEWEEAEMYISGENSVPKVGNLIFLKPDPVIRGELVMIGAESAIEPAEPEKDTAAAVAIIADITEEGIVVIQGNVENTVVERTIPFHDAAILGYGLVPERSPYAVQAVPSGELHHLGRTVNYASNMFTSGRTFVLYTQRDGNYYAIDGNGKAVPVWIQDGGVYSDSTKQDELRWTFTRSGTRYVIQNVGTGLYLHPYYNSEYDYGIINQTNWDTPVTTSGTGAKFIHSASARLSNDATVFEITRDQNMASVFYFGMAESCTVWLDGTNGGLSSLGGSQNQSYQVTAPSLMTLPEQWLSPTKYSFKLRGWYDVTHDRYYAPGESVSITENTVFYADWMAETYDIGQYNADVANTVSTNSFVTTRLFDYNYLFNVLSADSSGSISNTSHSESWNIVQRENVDYEDRETLDFIFLDYGSGGTLDYPGNRRNGVNQYPGEGIVTAGIYNDRIGEALFSTDDRIPGKVYLGTADHLFQIMDDPSNPYYGYYYYDSGKNAASYNQSAGRFYVYDYLEATSAEISATKSDFLPLNSPYVNTNGKNVATQDHNSGQAKYVYDAKYDGSGNSTNRVSTNYAFGMKSDIRFYLPNKPGEGGNQDLNGNDMRFTFSGDDDLWILVDGKLALDIGGIHQAESGEINFSTGQVMVQGKVNNALSSVITALEPGEHTLTMMYLERGASHSNCAIYFNLAPRFQLDIQKEDVLTRDLLNGAQFSVYLDLECTKPAQLWPSQARYLAGDPATNVFTVQNGSAHMWGMGAGNTYYIKETRPPDDTDYGFPNGVIRMVLDKRGAATYSVMILDGGDGISGGFTVHGFRVDDESQQAYIIATNAPKWVKEVTSVEARKFWADGKDHSGESVTVYLTVRNPDGTVTRLQETQLSDETDWQHLWENLPKFYEDGTPIEYGVEEAYSPGYYSKVEVMTGSEQVESAVEWKQVKTIAGNKTYLLRNSNNRYLSTNGSRFQWVNEATAKSSPEAQWTTSDGDGYYQFTNGTGYRIAFNSSNQFYANNGDYNKEHLFVETNGNQVRMGYYGDRKYYMTNTVNSSGYITSTNYTWNATSFTLYEKTVTYTSVEVEGEQAYKITNIPLDRETSMTVYKEWYNHLGDDPTLYEQAQVTVKLLANGKDTGRRVTLNLKNGWTDVFRGLPYQDDNGNVIVYTIEESWNSLDWLPEYGPVVTSGGSTPTYSTTVTNVYRWGHGVELPSTGTHARMLYMLCGGGLMLLSLVYGTVSRRKRERRMK